MELWLKFLITLVIWKSLEELNFVAVTLKCYFWSLLHANIMSFFDNYFMKRRLTRNLTWIDQRGFAQGTMGKILSENLFTCSDWLLAFASKSFFWDTLGLIFNYSYHTTFFLISKGLWFYLFSEVEFGSGALTADVEFFIVHLEPPSALHCLPLILTVAFRDGIEVSWTAEHLNVG